MASSGIEDAIKTIRAGTCCAEDCRYYIEQARSRVQWLREDEPVFGLVPAEKAELARLEAFLKDHPHA